MSDNNYLPPESELTIADVQPRTSFMGKWLALLGTLLLFCFPIGLISTIISIIGIFQDIKLDGVGDPKLIVEEISSALVSTLLGLVTALPGAILLCISITFFKHRQPWVYRASFVSAIVTLILFPIGTAVAIVIFVVLNKNKQEFFSAKGNS